MERKYKAFISYRHLPLEMEIAKKLHKRIEHYIIPHDLREDGNRKVGLVFRDQDELPISSNLTSNIETALDHSEFLIVICTPETSKSIWVLREISYFLEHHDREHVLAVLADGQPEESFPAQMTEIYSEAGELIDRVEPLAANIVADNKRKRNGLFRVESLRILASLIGCPFDALYRREQRYRMRRVILGAAAVTAIAGAFVGVLINRNAQIKSNYAQALRNQSNYLAAESLDLLDSGDRLSAICLAMEALPTVNRDRPRVSKAEYALGCALGAYITPGNVSGVRATGIIGHSNIVDSFRLNESGSVLCTITNEHILTCWDTETLQKRWELHPERDVDRVGVAGYFNDVDPILWTSESVYRISGKTGEILWQQDISKLEESKWSSGVFADFIESTNVIVLLSSTSIYQLDGESGGLISESRWPLLVIEEEEADFLQFLAKVSPDGEQIAAQFNYSLSGAKKKGIAVIEVQNGKLRTYHAGLPDHIYCPNEYVFSDANHLVFATIDLNADDNYTLMHAFSKQVRCAGVLNCLDLETGQLAWQSKHEYCSTAANEILLLDSTLMPKPILIYAYANHMDMLDPTTGDLLGGAEFLSRVISVDVLNSVIQCIMENGSWGQLDPQKPDEWYTNSTFVENISQANGRPGSYWVLQSGSELLIHYTAVEADPSWKSYEIRWEAPNTENSFYEDDYYLSDECIAFLDEYTLLLSNGDPEQPFRELTLPSGDNETYPRTKYQMGRYKNGVFSMIWTDAESCGIIRINTETMEFEVVPWKETEGNRPISFFADEEGSNWYIINCHDEIDDCGVSTQTISLFVLDDAMELCCQIPVCTFADIAKVEAVLLQEKWVYLYLPDLERVYCVDLEKKTVSISTEELKELFSNIKATGGTINDNTYWSQDGRFVAAETEMGVLNVCRTDGNGSYRIEDSSSDILSAAFMPGGKELLVVDSSGYMRRYRAEDGTLLGRTELYYGTLSDYTVIQWNFTKRGFLALGVGTLLNLISLEDWGTFAYVPSCYGYLEDRDFCFCYTYTSGSKAFGGFPRYSTETLLDYGESILNGWELSEELKMKYGLS